MVIGVCKVIIVSNPTAVKVELSCIEVVVGVLTIINSWGSAGPRVIVLDIADQIMQSSTIEHITLQNILLAFLSNKSRKDEILLDGYQLAWP